MRLQALVGAGLLCVATTTAHAQIRPVTPVVPVPVAPVPIAPQALRPAPLTPITPIVKPPLPVPPLPPVSPLPAPGVSVTRPEPPVIRENPPVLPTRHDDSPPEPRSRACDDDPLWMYKALDKLGKERKEWNVTYEPPQVPPPPPPPLPAMPLPAHPESSEKSKTPEKHWLVIAAIVVALGAFKLGRAIRTR